MKFSLFVWHLLLFLEEADTFALADTGTFFSLYCVTDYSHECIAKNNARGIICPSTKDFFGFFM